PPGTYRIPHKVKSLPNALSVSVSLAWVTSKADSCCAGCGGAGCTGLALSDTGVAATAVGTAAMALPGAGTDDAAAVVLTSRAAETGGGLWDAMLDGSRLHSATVARISRTAVAAVA